MRFRTFSLWDIYPSDGMAVADNAEHIRDHGVVAPVL